MSFQLGKRLAEYRYASGLSQAEVARRVRVDKSHISRIETRGREYRIPSSGLIARLGKLYQLTEKQIARLQALRSHELQSEVGT